jgi:phosphoserine phosphatase RsbU/P
VRDRRPEGTSLSQLSAPVLGTLSPEQRPLRLLLICEAEWPLVVRELIATRPIEVVQSHSLGQARESALLGEVDAVVICEAIPRGEARVAGSDTQLLADALVSHRLIGVVLPSVEPLADADENAAFVFLPGEVSVDELWGRLATIWQYRPVLRHMENQVTVMQRLGRKLSQQFTEVDQELRLASRLQRDFLPKSLPQLNDLRFSVLYRPATWVSGDVYDVRRLDESTLSFYLADAVGHGVAAGLLTMFIRQAISGKRINGDDYAIVPPEDVLAVLNAQLSQQELPNCQFVTACYGIIDTSNYQLTFARGGHPHPIHVKAGGEYEEVRSVGGLLGVFPEEVFPNISIVLEPGDKLVIYSDGIEDVVVKRPEHAESQVVLTPAFEKAAAGSADECIAGLVAELDGAEGSLQPADDQTCIVIERLKQ